ncbi:hypothetical protein [Nocardia tengchongensis]|uniref:hypothetical protein n=1 Tax=Nocardia tengchongensis TaxID=2055889 RepID=UPI003655F29E
MPIAEHPVATPTPREFNTPDEILIALLAVSADDAGHHQFACHWISSHGVHSETCRTDLADFIQRVTRRGERPYRFL